MRSKTMLFIVGAVLSCAARAGDDLVIPLKFIPTQNPAKVSAKIEEGVSNRPVAVAIEDVRQVPTRDLIGEGTGWKDDTFRIRYAGFLPTYLKTTLSDRFATWGIQVDEHSNLVLAVKVTRFHVKETHAIYGSQFTSEVQLPWTLMDRAGHVFASGTALGTGKTKGRWRNPINCEEVLADALQSAAVVMAGDAKLQEAWVAAAPQAAPVETVHIAQKPEAHPAPHGKAVAVAPGKTPAQLLDDVTKLRKQQLGTQVLVSYVSQQILSSAFSANDLVAWKKAGIPEPVMEAALRRAPE